MFQSIQDLVDQASARACPIHQLMLEQEMEMSGRSKEEIYAQMRSQVKVMRQAIETGIEGVTSHSGMTGGDAKKLYAAIQSGKTYSSITTLKAICYAIATNEVNASMGVICATPTAGSAGVLPGCLFAVAEYLGMDDEALLPFFFTGAAIGYVIANSAFIAGAQGGCQAEIGSASAMAAAALTEMQGGSPAQVGHAMAMALKNMLGLACDPLAGLVEVPCIKRNGAGASNALMASELAMAGIESKVPFDEVIEALYRIGLAMPATLKETSLAGLAATKTGRAWKDKLWKQIVIKAP